MLLVVRCVLLVDERCMLCVVCYVFVLIVVCVVLFVYFCLLFVDC